MQFYHKSHDFRILVAILCCHHLRTFSANFSLLECVHTGWSTFAMSILQPHNEYLVHTSIISLDTEEYLGYQCFIPS